MWKGPHSLIFMWLTLLTYGRFKHRWSWLWHPAQCAGLLAPLTVLVGWSSALSDYAGAGEVGYTAIRELYLRLVPHSLSNVLEILTFPLVTFIVTLPASLFLLTHIALRDTPMDGRGRLGINHTFKRCASAVKQWTDDVRGVVLPFWRALFAGLVLLPLVRRPQWHPLLVPMALCYAAMNVTYLSAMSYTGAANVIWLQMTAPAWVFLLGRLWLKERATRRDTVMFCFAVAGIATIVWFEVQRSQFHGVVLGLASGLFYGGIVLFLRRLKEIDSAWLIVVNMAVTAAVTAPSALRPEVWPNAAQLATAAAFGVVQLGLPYVCFARGLRKVPSQEATGIGLLEPVLLPVWVYLAWQEPTAWWTMVGAGMILVGLALRYMPRRDARAD